MTSHTVCEASVNSLLLAEQYIAYIPQFVAKSTVNNRRSLLLPILKELNLNIQQITIFDIDLYMAERAHRDKPTTISTKRQVLRSFFQYCEEYREINLAFHWDAIHRKKVKAPRKQVFTREEVQKVIDNCKHRQDSLMVSVLFYTGVRISELLSIRITDIHRTQIRIRGKGSYDRVVHMPSSLAEEIKHYTSLREGGYLFKPLQRHNSHPTDRYISAYTVRERMRREFKRILGKDMHPHQLRHSFSVDWLLRGGDLRTLQIILGHESIETTMVYLGLTDIHTADIYARVFAT